MRPFLWLLATALVVSGQTPAVLQLSHTVEMDVKPGARQAYTVSLGAGDYASGEIVEHDTKVKLSVLNPDGSSLREFGDGGEGKVRFAFVAETAGVYRLEVTVAEKAGPGKYEIKLAQHLPLNERLQAAAPADRYTSPRIEELRKRLAGNPGATEEFWKQVKEEGTPLIEKIDKDERHQLVTFLWRGSATTRNVMVMFFPFTAAHPDDHLMRRVGDTDVWYRTLRVPAGARFAYTLSVNDPLVFNGGAAEQRMATVQADPLNRHRWFYHADATKFEYYSSVELPGAPPQPWIDKKQGVPEGLIGTHQFKSEILKNERSLSVYTPHGYSTDHRPYGMLVLFDESAYMNMVPTPTILDNLIAAGRIPPVVAVLIGNPSQAARSKELPPNPDFADFLAKELAPWMRAHYNVTSDPRETIVGGSSFGGIAATYAGLRHPEVFGNVLCQSGSFWWAPDRKYGGPDAIEREGGWLAKQFIASPKLALKFYMDAGWFEVDLDGGGGSIVEPSRHMRDVLLAKGYEVHYRENPAGHDYLTWRGTLADGLIVLAGM